MKTNFNQPTTYLKRVFCVCSFFIFPFLQAQNPSSSENYVLIVELLEPLGSVPSNLNSVPDAHKKVSILYFDDLGREKQSIIHKGTPEGKDIVTQFEYDGLGRQVKDYLPAPTTQINGAFIPDPTSAYTSHYGSFPYNTALYYSEKELENSALNRLVKQGAPGEDWGLESGHTIAFKQSSNSAVEVDLYWIDGNGNLKKGGHSLGDKYPAKALRRSMITDENGNFTFEFKDKQGRIVLKRSKVEVEAKAKDPGPGTPVYENADTYYVYDIYGNLTYVIPPNAASVIPIGTVSSLLLKDLCYTYKYDPYNRLVERRLPGKGWEYMVYDKQNRLVATQDANLRADGKWLFTKYDKFGRVVYTGIYAGGTNRGTVQTAANNAGSNNEKRETTLKFTKNGLGVYYTSTAFPSSFNELLNVNYYDTYTNLGFNELDQFEMQPVKDGEEETNNLKGYPVATFVRALGTSAWEKSFTVYDTKTRVVGVFKSNHLGGFTKTESDLDFRGKPQKTETVHKRNATGVEVKTNDYYTYDNMERPTSHYQSINGSVRNLIADSEYNRLGQLQTKYVGGMLGKVIDRWQKIDYSYNIRGWLTHINNPLELIAGENTTPPAPNDDLFAFQIRYNNPTGETKPLYNGNISQTTWKTASDNTQRGYHYTYDQLNRLRRADFYKQGTGNITAYGEFISYDLNGNITNLVRTTGDANDNEIEMDDLTYTYQNGNGMSNVLVNVEDAVSSGSSEGFKDGNTDPMLDDYEYDANGNMIKDRNKGISSITYNHLNLPTEIKFEETTNKITYLYNAAGQKLKKTVFYSDSIKIVDYLDGFQYAGNVLQFFPHPEGYVKATPLSLGGNITGYAYNYVFNYTDHLGNVRLSYSKDPQTHQLKILEENHYYPFGLKHSVYSGGRLKGFKATSGGIGGTVLESVTETDYHYRYNNREWQDELGLNMYAMDMRQYDPAIARWVVLDPVIHHSMSPYNAFDNNPVFWADPSGANSIFDQQGTSYSSITTATGMSISAGGAGDDEKSSENPPQGGWYWSKADRTYVYDKSIKSASDFKALAEALGIEGHFIDTSRGLAHRQVTSIEGEILAEVTLFATGGWINKSGANTHQIPLENTTTISPQYSGGDYAFSVKTIMDNAQTISFGGSGYLGLGGGVEVGFFNGNYDKSIYLTLKGGSGVGGGFDIFSMNSISSGNGNQITASSFSGWGWNASVNASMFSTSYGANFDRNNRFNSTGFGGTSPIKPTLKSVFSGGFNANVGYTWNLFKW